MHRNRGTRAWLSLTFLALGSFAFLRWSRTLGEVQGPRLEAEQRPASGSNAPERIAEHPTAQDTGREPASATPIQGSSSEESAFLSGRVVERSGRPLTGVPCELHPSVGGGGFFERPTFETRVPAAKQVTDAEGRFRFATGPRHWRLRVEYPGYAHWERDHLLGGDEVRVILDAEIRLAIIVLDAAGAPVEMADVVARETGGSEPDDCRARLRTDSRGRAETSALAPGSWRLTVRHPDFAAVAVPVEIPVGVSRVDREVVLERGARLTGRVLTEEGEPIPGASVRVESPYQETFLLMELTCDASGRYTSDPNFSAFETLEVVASAAGHAESSQLVGIQPSAVTAGEAQVDFLLLRSTCPLRGRVVDGSGTALAASSVRVASIELTATSPDDPLGFLQGAPRAPWLWQEAARTDESGAFELSTLTCVTEYAILILHEGYAPRVVWRAASESDSATDLGDIQLIPQGTLRGRASWEGGTPAARQRLAIGRASRVHFRDRSELWAWRPDGWFQALETVTDEQGCFRFDQLAPGTYNFLASPTTMAEVLPGATSGPIEVVLPGRAPGSEHRLAGVVRGPHGNPVALTFVRAFVPDGAGESLAASCLTDAKGTFMLGLPLGSAVRLVLTDLHGAHEDETVHLDPALAGDRLEIVLQDRALPLPPLDGAVFGPRGEPIEGGTVTLHPPEDSLCACVTFQKRTDATGSFRFSVAEGPHRLVASDPRYASATHAPAWPGDHVLFDLQER